MAGRSFGCGRQAKLHVTGRIDRGLGTGADVSLMTALQESMSKHAAEPSGFRVRRRAAPWNDQIQVLQKVPRYSPGHAAGSSTHGADLLVVSTATLGMRTRLPMKQRALSSHVMVSA